MMFEAMMAVVKGFKKLNNNPITTKSTEYLEKLVRVSKKNGLVEFKEENGEKILFFGDYNREMVKIKVKETKNGFKHQINYNNLLSEVTKQGIAAGK